MGINIRLAVKRILHTNQDINSILITDRDGVPVIKEGKYLIRSLDS